MTSDPLCLPLYASPFMPSMGSPPSSTTVADRPVLCPACGYDLRASTGNTCSECGLAWDRTEATRSAVPWAYRAQRGRLRAFWQTVIGVTRDAKALRHENVK